jgi:formylglycine-generating enzyme required for sulfatase activity
MEGLTPVNTYNGSTYKKSEPIHPSISQNLSANGYRLPQFSESFFAAGGGTLTHGYKYAGSNNLNVVGWYSGNCSGSACDSGRGTWPVGQKAANELGLYDMSGNVWEWCWDANDTGSLRVIRGGSYISSADDCVLSWATDIDNPDFRHNSYGFRLARSSGN